MSAPAFGLLSYPGIANLGDPMQSLAARRFLPRVDALVERERISEPPPGGHERLRVILNGWFMHDANYWPPHPSIEPLPLAMHFVEPGRSRLRRWAKLPLERMMSGAGADWLRQWGPIGARDQFTAEQLEARGIPAWHSGCLTLTLPRPEDATTHGRIIACDLPDKALDALRRNSPHAVEAVTHEGGEHLSVEEQMAAAAGLLELYAGAACVVTTRIHAAMPCLGIGTPVLLLVPANAGRRVRDQLSLMHHCDQGDFVAGRCDYDLRDPPPNPQTHLPLAAELNQRARAFVAR